MRDIDYSKIDNFFMSKIYTATLVLLNISSEITTVDCKVYQTVDGSGSGNGYGNGSGNGSGNG